MRTLIEASAASAGAPTARQIGNLYKSFMDEARVEALDAKPLASDLATIAAVTSKAEFATLMAKTTSNVGRSRVFAAGLRRRQEARSRCCISARADSACRTGTTTSKPNFKEKKAAYEAFIARSLSLINAPAPEATAKAVLAFETEIAQASWPIAERRDIDKVYNPMTTEALQAYAPAINWRAYLEAAGVKGVDSVIVTETTAVQKIAQIFDKTPLETLKAWETFHFVNGASPYLSKRFVESEFEFSGRALSGTPTIRPRWKRGVSLVDANLGDAVGKEYVAKYFPPDSKAKMDDLVANLKTAMVARIGGLSWMSAQTKEQALVKLSKMSVMVGYPVKWRDYSTLTLEPDDLYGNIARSIAFEAAYQFAKVGKPVDRSEWAMTPQTVDAYNGGLENKIVFPAGILQAPLFNPCCRSGRELRRHRRHHRPRDHARVRRPGPEDRLDRRVARLVDGRRREALRGRERQAGRSIQQL